MKIKKKTNNARPTANQPRRSYSPEYIQQALALAERQDVTAASRPLSTNRNPTPTVFVSLR